MADRKAEGRATRARILGEAHVARAEANTTGFDAPFQAFITEGVWGSVWSRPGLTPRERSLLTIALLAGLGATEELAMHVRATANTGATEDDLAEVMLHVAAYAGVPRANSAIQTIKATYAELRSAEAAKE
ncbi:MAG: 4-carboxymuconolactone decarboxylase [Pseudomonadota bacterium]